MTEAEIAEDLRDQGFDVDFDFPFNKVHGNFLREETYPMCIEFEKKHHQKIDEISNSVIEKMMSTNSDLLTEGRQTMCRLRLKSMPAPQAYANFLDVMTDNSGKKTFSMVELAQSIISLFEKKSIVAVVQRRKTEYKEEYDEEDHITVRSAVVKITYSKQKIEGNENV